MNKHLLLARLRAVAIFMVNGDGNDRGYGCGDGDGYGYADGDGDGDAHGDGEGGGDGAGDEFIPSNGFSYGYGAGQVIYGLISLENSNE
jgi:hypothetical protein